MMWTERGLVHLASFKSITCNNILTDYYGIDEYGCIINFQRNRIVRPHPDKDGYLHLMLCTNEILPNGNHKRVDFRVASLVAKTFIGEPPSHLKDPTVDHINRNIKDNHYGNLRWIERGRNSSIRQNKGVGQTNHEAKLSNDDVTIICQLLCKGELLKDIATRFNVRPSTISNIKQRRNWTHISKDYL